MKYLHFVGIGGIGMSGLASWCRALGYKVSGSDRDAGKSENAHILSPLKAQGITIYPQDGSYANDGTPDALVFSSAIEEGNPDFKAGAGLPRLHRSQLLSQLVTGLSKQGIAVAGSCGKSTVTAFLSEALLHCGQDAGFLNGAISKRYISNSSIGNFHEGTGDFFIFEADESDKSLVNYAPDYAIVLNMGTDHYSKEELAQVFAAFLNRVKKGAVIEQDVYTAVKPFLNNPDLTIKVFSAVPSQEADHFLETYTITRGTDGALQPAACFNDGSRILLPAPGRHTAANALAIFALLEMLGIPPHKALKAVETFDGIRRRNDCVGMTAEGVPVYDDYAHNPEKIASCIRMLSEITPGRLFVIFQPHGFGPLGFFRDELFETLEKTLKEKDAFFMLPPFYAGGTSSFKPTSQEVIAQYKENASAPEKYHFADDREVLRTRILAEVQKGDLIVVMGARDNSLSLYANSFCKVSQA